MKTHLFHTALVEILQLEELDEIWCQYTRMMVGLLHGSLFTATHLFITNNRLHLKFTHVYAVGLQCAAKKYW